jgi:plasmid stability protein
LDAVTVEGLPWRKRASGFGVGLRFSFWNRDFRQEETEARSPYCAISAINAIIDGMASITIRKLPENTKRRLRIRAARNGRSMEQEARELLEAGLARVDAEPVNVGEAIRRIFAPLGGVELKIPPRRGKIREISFE